MKKISVNGKVLADAIANKVTSEPEWARPPRDGEHLEGLTRSYIYKLMDEGKVQSISLLQPGKKKGCRLICLRSLRAFLSRVAEEQFGSAV